MFARLGKICEYDMRSIAEVCTVRCITLILEEYRSCRAVKCAVEYSEHGAGACTHFCVVAKCGMLQLIGCFNTFNYKCRIALIDDVSSESVNAPDTVSFCSPSTCCSECLIPYIILGLCSYVTNCNCCAAVNAGNFFD